MRILGKTPYPSTSYVWRDANAKKYRVFIMAAVFGIYPDGRLKDVTDSTAIQKQDIYYGKPGTSSIRLESDLVPYKSCGEGYLVDAITRKPKQSTQWLKAGIQIGSIKHSVRVCGKRFWRKNLFSGYSLSEPADVDEIPIQYENAYGGRCPTDATNRYAANPLGKGYWKVEEDGDAHCIEPSEGCVSPEQAAGLTPIDRSWMPRSTYLGRIDDDWKRNQWPLVPKDFDYDYFLASPPEMRLNKNSYFHGNETVTISNIKSNGWVRFNLPDSNTYYLAQIQRNQKTKLTPFVLDTIIINCRYSWVKLVWRQSVVGTDGFDVLVGTKNTFLRLREKEKVNA